ncbi:MAG: class II aldolase/adducin family protein [Rhodoplanes sp.]
MCASSDDAAPVNSLKAPAGAGNRTTTAGRDLVDDLVVANHILFDQGVVDAFGHVSVRHDQRADRFLLACNIAPGSVTADDILEYGLDGEPIAPDGRRLYAERYIHSEIYREYPHVIAVVHSHSHAIVPLSVLKSTPLRAIFHMAGFIGESAPVFDIRDVAGPGTDLLISNGSLGRALAKCFAKSNIVLMRGHGSTVIAPSLRQVVYRAVYAEINARYQLATMPLGEVNYLTAEEAKSCERNIEAHVQRPWDLWKKQAQERRTRR